MHLVEVTSLIPSVKLDIKYASTNNVTGRILYEGPQAFIEYEAGIALINVQNQLAGHGYGLVIWDAYRPLSVTKLLWELAPEENKELTFADPKDGSIHNRGCAIDATLYDLKSGKELSMPSDFDDNTDKARQGYSKLSLRVTTRREVLRDAFESHGFICDKYEWWHFNWNNWRMYEILDIPFDALLPKKD